MGKRPAQLTLTVKGDNDDKPLVKMFSTCTLELRGDSLEGTTKIAAMDGSFESPDRRFAAKRAKP